MNDLKLTVDREANPRSGERLEMVVQESDVATFVAVLEFLENRFRAEKRETFVRNTPSGVYEIVTVPFPPLHEH
jgi:predicted proteasome-type protease